MTKISPREEQTSRRTVIVVAVGVVAAICIATCLFIDNSKDNSKSSSPPAKAEPDLQRKVHSKTQIELVFIKGGRFQMGSPESEPDRLEGESLHSVVVSDFWIGKTEVTREQYALYLKDNPSVPEPKYWSDTRYNHAQQPMIGVSWEEVQAYIAWADLRLPTEAEWEYAARAGTTTAYFSGNSEEDLNAVGWHDGNSGYGLRKVAQKTENPFGLFDMHGNAWEWCSDWYGDYDSNAVQNPLGPTSGTRRTVRGGSWDDPPHCARSAHRVGFIPTERFRQVGFRVALSSESIR